MKEPAALIQNQYSNRLISVSVQLVGDNVSVKPSGAVVRQHLGDLRRGNDGP